MFPGHTGSARARRRRKRCCYPVFIDEPSTVDLPSSNKNGPSPTRRTRPSAGPALPLNRRGDAGTDPGAQRAPGRSEARQGGPACLPMRPRPLPPSPSRPCAPVGGDPAGGDHGQGRAVTDTQITGAAQPLNIPSGRTSWLRITIAATRGGTRGGPGAGISDVLIPGVRVTRFLQPSQQPGPAPSFSFECDTDTTGGLPGIPPEPALDRTFTTASARPAADRHRPQPEGPGRRAGGAGRVGHGHGRPWPADRLVGNRVPDRHDRLRRPVLPRGPPGRQRGLDRDPERAPAHAGDAGWLAAGLRGAGRARRNRRAGVHPGHRIPPGAGRLRDRRRRGDRGGGLAVAAPPQPAVRSRTRGCPGGGAGRLRLPAGPDRLLARRRGRDRGAGPGRRPGRARCPGRAAAGLVAAPLGAVAGVRRDVRRGRGDGQRADPRHAARLRGVQLARAGPGAGRAGRGADRRSARPARSARSARPGVPGPRPQPVPAGGARTSDDHARADVAAATGRTIHSARSARSRNSTSTWTVRTSRTWSRWRRARGHLDRGALAAALPRRGRRPGGPAAPRRRVPVGPPPAVAGRGRG